MAPRLNCSFYLRLVVDKAPLQRRAGLSAAGGTGLSTGTTGGLGTTTALLSETTAARGRVTVAALHARAHATVARVDGARDAVVLLHVQLGQRVVWGERGGVSDQTLFVTLPKKPLDEHSL